MPPKLSFIREKLLEHHGPQSEPVSRDPFHLILWEQVAYLADDSRRLKAFQLLEDRVGLDPGHIQAAPIRVLREIAKTGGSIAFEKRAERMQESARQVISDWGGNLTEALRLPVDKAVRALLKFPMIGKPGAEKILLFSKTYPLLALDSNGLRTLLRLGYGRDEGRYDATYKSVRVATETQRKADFYWLISLHQLLRCHGKTICRSSGPDCRGCPLQKKCPYPPLELSE